MSPLSSPSRVEVAFTFVVFVLGVTSAVRLRVRARPRVVLGPRLLPRCRLNLSVFSFALVLFVVAIASRRLAFLLHRHPLHLL